MNGEQEREFSSSTDVSDTLWWRLQVRNAVEVSSMVLFSPVPGTHRKAKIRRDHSTTPVANPGLPYKRIILGQYVVFA